MKKWDNSDKQALLAFKKSIDNDDIKLKEQVKKILLNNRFIIHVLHNEELELLESEPDDYFGKNILDYYLIKPTQTDIKNFLCFETNYEFVGRSNTYKTNNPAAKKMQLIFYILCHHDDIIDEDTGVARHDLLTALIQYEFNYSTKLGDRLKLISDIASVVDTDYACRTLVFEMITDNNLVKTYDGTPYIVNKQVQEYVSPT